MAAQNVLATQAELAALWQREQLEKLTDSDGNTLSFFEIDDAMRLGVDFRDVAAFLDNNVGCPVSHAYRIVAPLEA